jgi:hypothetical protein
MRSPVLLASCWSLAVGGGCLSEVQPRESPIDGSSPPVDAGAGEGAAHDAADATLDVVADGPSSPVGDGPQGDSPCGDTRTDPHNCGVCGNDCLGGACESSVCVPLASDVLATGQHNPAGVAVDETSVYWVNLGTYAPSDAGKYVDGQIMKCSKAGCNNDPTVLATGSWNGMAKVALDATSVYWFATGLVLKCPLDGCSGSPVVLWSGQDVLSDIVVAGGNVYFADLTQSQILACPVDGCGASPDVAWTFADGGAADEAPLGIAADATNLYFTTTASDVYTCAVSACMATGRLLVTPNALIVAQIAVDTTNVYFTEAVGLANGHVFAFNKAGDSMLTTLLDGLNFPVGIATDGTDLYFTEQGAPVDGGALGTGRVARCAVMGCNNMATALAGYVTQPQGIALDDSNVYWTDFGSSTDRTQSNDGRVVARPK